MSQRLQIKELPSESPTPEEENVKPAVARSSNATAKVDKIIKELNEATALFLQTLRTKHSSDTNERKNSATGDHSDNDILALFSKESSSDDLLANSSSFDMKGSLKLSSSASTISSRCKYFVKNDDDDGMSTELSRLDVSQENLRKELDLATCGFGLITYASQTQQVQHPTPTVWGRLCCCCSSRKK